MIAGMLIAILLPTALGLLVIAVALRNDPEAGLLERLALAYPLGVTFVTLQMFLLGLLRVPLTTANTTAPVVVEIMALFYWSRRSNAVLLPRPSPGFIREVLSKDHRWWRRIALAVLMIWAVAKITSLFLETGLRPIYAWDSWANWSATAKLFYYAKGLLLDEPAEAFFGKGVVLRIIGYPLHNPLMQVWMANWAGGFDEVLVKFTTPMLLVCGAVYLYHMALREIGRLAALAMLVIFLSSPLLSYHGIEVYSDLPVGIYLLFALISFLRAMRGSPAHWTLTGLFSAGALFTKDEAAIFVAVLLVSAAFYFWKNVAPGKERRKTALGLLTPLVAIIPWVIFKVYHGFGIGGVGVGAAGTKTAFVFHPEDVATAFQNVLGLDNFGIVPLAIPVLMLVAGKPSREFLHLFFVVLCYAASFLLFYVIQDMYHTHFNMGTLFYRNVLTYYPMLCVLTVLLVKRALPVDRPGTGAVRAKTKKHR